MKQRNSTIRSKKILPILLFSYFIRVGLALCGGQNFWADELRYLRGIRLTNALFHFNFANSLKLLVSADHPLFTWICLPATFIQTLLQIVFKIPTSNTLWIGAIYLSAFSVLCILLVYALTLRSGGSEDEATLSAFFSALSGGLFYYSRHLLPYDAALAGGLFGLWLVTGTETSRLKSFLASLALSASVFLYFGLWPFSLVVGIFHIYENESWRVRIERLMILSIGAFAPFLILFAMDRLLGDGNFLVNVLKFSKTITQGDPNEGWSFVWEYLYHSDPILLFIFTGCMIYCLFNIARMKAWKLAHRRVFNHWLSLILGIYFFLVLSSTVLGKFVIYGRLVRPLIPLFCLISARIVFSTLHVNKWDKITRTFLVFVLILGASLGYAEAYMLKFPSEFKKQATPYCRKILEDYLITEEASHPQYPQQGDCISYNTRTRWTAWEANPIPKGEVLFRHAHPMQIFLPYQYEGFNPEQRNMFRSWDFSMLIVRLQSSQNSSPVSSQ